MKFVEWSMPGTEFVHGNGGYGGTFDFNGTHAHLARVHCTTHGVVHPDA